MAQIINVDCAFRPTDAPDYKKSDDKKLLTEDEVCNRYRLLPQALSNWIRLRRIAPVRRRNRIGERGTKWGFRAGDIVKAIETSEAEPGTAKRDASLG